MEIAFKVTNNMVVVSYHYAAVAHQAGVRDFDITFKLLEGRMVSQTFAGKNLALKLKGTRGVVVSSGKLAQKDYAIELNSAHGIADWFMGSGYRKALNLILTSKEFNQETMKKAETQLQQQIVGIIAANKEKKLLLI